MASRYDTAGHDLYPALLADLSTDRRPMPTGACMPTRIGRTVPEWGCVVVVILEWVDWYNNDRLHATLDHQPPEEYEQTEYARAIYAREMGWLPDEAANKTVE